MTFRRATLSPYLSTALGHIAGSITDQGNTALAAAGAGVLRDGVSLHPTGMDSTADIS